MAESRFLEAPLVRQEDGELKNTYLKRIGAKTGLCKKYFYTQS